MRARTLLLLTLALVAAGTTYVLAQNWIEAQRGALTRTAKQEKPKLSPTVEILVAGSDLSAGQFIKKSQLRWQVWPKDGVADSYFMKGKKYTTKDASGEVVKLDVFDAFSGAVVRNRISAGEPITDGRVVRPGDRGFLAAVLAPGNRAVSVPINATTGISGFVFPGDRVDLLLTHTITENNDSEDVRRATETVLRDIRVLAVDQRMDDTEGKASVAKTATLEVTPKQAEIIAVASDLGRLSLSLRSLANDAPKDVRPANRAYTWDTEASRLLPRKNTANVVSVKVFRGNEVSAVNFQRKSGQGYSVSGETVLNGSSAAVQNAQNAANQTVLNGASSTGKVGKLTQKVN